MSTMGSASAVKAPSKARSSAAKAPTERGHTDGADSDADLTVEQLAVTVGMSVRNIRHHHSRGLLPPPDVRKRVGYYNADHVARLRLITELQADGFNLTTIKRMLDASHGSAARMLGLRNALMAPLKHETPDVVTGEELREARSELTAEDIDLVLIGKLRLFVPLGGDRYERASPALAQAYEEVLAAGIPASALIELAERLHRDCKSIARRFLKLYTDELWEPFAQAGQPEERWDEMISTIGTLRALAPEVLLAMFNLCISEEIEATSAKLLDDQARRSQITRRPG
jgi:DNA-binding transcriptional MerR regulator